MLNLTSILETKVSNALPEKFSLVFDGWSSGDTHFVAIFAAFPSFTSCGYQKFLIAFSPLEEEDRLDADSHYSFMKFALDVYGKSFRNVVCITGDNCANNLRLAKLINEDYPDCQFLGCASHRFQLAVKDILEPHKHALEKLNKLMKKLKHLVPAAKL